MGLPAALTRSSIDESTRRRAAERLDVVGAPPEARFDRITRLAAQVLGVPIVYLSVIDGDDLWFRSTSGLELESAPRQDTLCETAIQDNATLVVPDASQDDRFAHLPAVAGDLHFRAYVGQPITDDEGIAIGTFCVVDTQARDFTAAQLQLLAELAGWARQEMLRTSDSTRARAVQQRLLPDRLPQPEGYDIAGYCVASQSVGGDFYDADRLPQGVGLVLADTMGKGTGAALVSATVRAAVRGSVRATFSHRPAAFADPAQLVGDLLGDVSAALQRDLEQTATLVTVLLAHLSPATHELAWADAGHGLAVVVGADGATTWLCSTDLPLGVMAEAGWTGRSHHLRPGDVALLFSDGLLDLLGGRPEHLQEIAALALDVDSAAEVVARIDALCAHTLLTDDVTAVVIRRAP